MMEFGVLYKSSRQQKPKADGFNPRIDTSQNVKYLDESLLSSLTNMSGSISTKCSKRVWLPGSQAMAKVFHLLKLVLVVLSDSRLANHSQNFVD